MSEIQATPIQARIEALARASETKSEAFNSIQSINKNQNPLVINHA
jgi:hypothetical protein